MGKTGQYTGGIAEDIQPGNYSWMDGFPGIPGLCIQKTSMRIWIPRKISLDGYPETSLPDTQGYTHTHAQVWWPRYYLSGGVGTANKWQCSISEGTAVANLLSYFFIEGKFQIWVALVISLPRGLVFRCGQELLR